MAKFLVTATTTHLIDDPSVNTPEEAIEEAKIDIELGMHETIDLVAERQDG